MKIAISCHPSHGGSGVVATELAMALADRGHEVHVICHTRPFRLVDRPRLHFHKVNITAYPLFKYPPHDLCLANKMAEVAAAEKLDIIHAHYAVPHTVSAILAREMLCVCEHPVKVVTTLHGTDITLVGSHDDFRRVCRWSMLKCHGLTGVSDWLAERTVQAFDLPDPPQVIANFVDCDRFHPNGRAGYPDGQPFRLLHASNFRPVKRVFDIIRVFERVRREIDAELVMIGDGPERGLAQELAAELGVCRYTQFIGNQAEMSQAYRDSHLYLLLSEYESFGLSALEAMACGTPVLGTSSGGLREVIVNEVGGMLRPVGDIEALSRAALDILKDADNWQCQSRQARDFARATFCMTKIVPQYEAFYRQVMEREEHEVHTQHSGPRGTTE